MAGKSVSFAVKRDIAVLAVIVIYFLAVCLLLSRMLGPFRGDPDYQYLMAGLNILNLQTPGYVDHPGTPTQTAIAVISFFTWVVTLPWHGFNNIVDEALTHSQFYLACCYAAFAAAMAAAGVFFAWSVRTASGSIAPALVGLFAMFSAAAVFAVFRHVDAEPVLLIGTLALAGFLARVAYAQPDEPTPPRVTIGIGVCIALCITAKVTSAPILLSILILRGGAAKRRALIAFIASGFVLLLPIIRQFRVMLRSYWGILTHRGVYGTGGAGVPTPAELWQNINDLWQTVPELFEAAALFLAVVIVVRLLRRRLPYNFERALLVCVAVIVAGIGLVSRQPRDYYLIPELAFAGLGIAIVFSALTRRLPFAYLLAAALCLYFAKITYQANSLHAQQEQAEWLDDRRLMDHAAHTGCFIVQYYFVDTPEWNMSIGNNSSGGQFSERLLRLFPNFITYDLGQKQFQTYAGPLTPEQAIKRFSREKCVYMMGIVWEARYGIADRFLPVVDHSQFHWLYALKPGWSTSGTE